MKYLEIVEGEIPAAQVRTEESPAVVTPDNVLEAFELARSVTTDDAAVRQLVDAVCLLAGELVAIASGLRRGRVQVQPLTSPPIGN